MAVIALLIPFPTLLWASNAGTSGGTVLNVPVGARAIAMGEAFTAQADDVSSLYWNPAGLAFLNQSQASFMYNQYLKDLTYNNAAVAVPLENAALGGSASYLSYGHIAGADAAGNPTADVNAYSGVATVGGAWLGNNWAAGFNLKAVQESLADVKATGVAADVGATLIYPEEIKGGTLRAAAVLRNVGSGLKFINQTDPFPRQWRAGVAAVQMMDRKLNMSLDYGKERDSDGAVYAGAEYWLIPYLALRGGYAGSDTQGNGVRAGIGLKFKDISFDYAYSSYGELGFAHRYELSLRFGAIQPRLTPEERRILRRAKIAMAEERFGEATLLLDSLVQLEPAYKPVRRLVKTSMLSYDKQERAGIMTFHALNPAHPQKQTVDNGEDLKELETLLNINDDALAQMPPAPSQEKK